MTNTDEYFAQATKSALLSNLLLLTGFRARTPWSNSWIHETKYWRFSTFPVKARNRRSVYTWYGLCFPTGIIYITLIPFSNCSILTLPRTNRAIFNIQCNRLWINESFHPSNLCYNYRNFFRRWVQRILQRTSDDASLGWTTRGKGLFSPTLMKTSYLI